MIWKNVLKIEPELNKEYLVYIDTWDSIEIARFKKSSSGKFYCIVNNTTCFGNYYMELPYKPIEIKTI